MLVVLQQGLQVRASVIYDDNGYIDFLKYLTRLTNSRLTKIRCFYRYLCY